MHLLTQITIVATICIAKGYMVNYCRPVQRIEYNFNTPFPVPASCITASLKRCHCFTDMFNFLTLIKQIISARVRKTKSTAHLGYMSGDTIAVCLEEGRFCHRERH